MANHEQKDISCDIISSSTHQKNVDVLIGKIIFWVMYQIYNEFLQMPNFMEPAENENNENIICVHLNHSDNANGLEYGLCIIRETGGLCK